MNFTNFGRYILLLKSVFRRPEKLKIYLKEIAKQMDYVGVGSLGLIAIISTFIGAVMTLQIAFQLVSDFIPKTIIGSVNRDSSILELSPTISAIVLAGKIGSAISSEIGSMRVTEQIDALEIMGINTKNYLILPKILGAFTMVPILVGISAVVGIWGGYIVGNYTGSVPSEIFLTGIRQGVVINYMIIALYKSVIFSFIISTVPCYFGYNVKGGALEIGKAGTRSVVVSCILILIADYIVAAIAL